jgi:hypothetical protein
LWKEYKLQTYFTIKGCIDYFVVVDREKGRETARGSILLIEPEKDYKNVKCNLKKQATVV